MKKTIAFLIAPRLAVLCVGYYNSIEDAEIHTHFFHQKETYTATKIF